MVNSRPPMGAAKAVATPINSERKGCCKSCRKGREGKGRGGGGKG